MSLNSFMSDKMKPLPIPERKPMEDAFAKLQIGVIPEGQRNSTMSRIAACLIKRYGDTPEAYALFLEKSNTCDPPLGDAELKAI